MGQQQLLLIVLVMIAVGTAILVGFQIYDTTNREAAIDFMTTDLTNLAGMAMNFYRTPADLGGGGQSFTGKNEEWEVPPSFVQFNDRQYAVSTISDYSLELVGTSLDEDTGTNGENGVLVYVELDRNGISGFRIEN